jgi:hypothetical protein
MDETQTLAVQALRDLLDNLDRSDWDELLAVNRALIKAIAKNKPMTRNNARVVAEYLREAGWRERTIGAATQLGPNLLADRGRHEDDPIQTGGGTTGERARTRPRDADQCERHKLAHEAAHYRRAD